MNLLQIGDKEVKLGNRVVSKQLISEFATLTGDKNLLHVNDSYAKSGGFEQTIAHGMLTVSLIIGLMYESGLFDDVETIFSELKLVKFIKPVYPETIISATVKIKETYASKSNNGTYVIVNIDGFEQESVNLFVKCEAKFKIISEVK
ncbi:MAG: MaoC family dehydratase [Thermoplasmatales archaeon]